MAWNRKGPARGRGKSRGAGRAGRGARGGRVDSSGNARISSPDYDQSAHEQYVDLRRLLRYNPILTDFHNVDQNCRVWSAALAILDGDSRDFHQCVARDLASDELQGHEIILTTATACSRNSDDMTGLRLATLFLRVLTHSALLDSISVDSFLGVIYRSFGGTSGERALNLFSNLCQRLTNLVTRSNEISVTSLAAKMATLMLRALHQLLVREQKARFNDTIAPLFEAIDGLINIVATSDPSAQFQSWKQQLDTLRKIVDIATGRLGNDGHIDNIVATLTRPTSSFPLPMTTPGGRHDNDHADITKIQVLPTIDEISCGQADYLPSTNLSQPHHLHDHVHRHIDSMFRLLRHDIFASVKDVLSEMLIQNDPKHPTVATNDARAHAYTQASIRHVFIHERHGLQAILYFTAPPQVRRKSKAEQRRWWQETSRLEEGSLVSLLAESNDQKFVLFLEVFARKTELEREQRQEQKNTSCLVSNTGLPSITVKLATKLEHDLKLLTKMHGQSTQFNGTLVEFNGLLPATFNPILKNLQRMMGEGHMAFQQWLLPGTHSTGTQTTLVPPPAYARKPGFLFCLDSILQGGQTGNQTLSLAASGESDWAAEAQMLSERTSLDLGQCIGLLAALRREYALIQGPPGTGKSYLGVQLVRALLDNKQKADLGPILVICYTNHALDQFLNHLLDVGILRVIRIGGRSLEPKLEGKNLRVVSKGVPRTRVEGQILGKAYNDLEMYTDTAGRTLKPLHQGRKGASWEVLGDYIKKNSHPVHQQLEHGTEETEGWQSVSRDPLLAWLGKRPPSNIVNNDKQSTQELKRLQKRAEQSIAALTQSERWRLVDYWLQGMRDEQAGRLFECLDAVERNQAAINSVHDDINRRALIQADVIGVTTTALAKNITLLRHVRSKVVICEEAGEVMEPHILSALIPGVEHLIQIGDHRQLRPQINNYSLSTESSTGLTYQLDRSQFERRAMGEPCMEPAPIAQLNVQRRMRPEISSLIRDIYPSLQDHHSVKSLPDVVGMRHNLFWLTHDHAEDSTNDGARVRSHSNEWEVSMVSGLVRHLVCQGTYSSTDIALLTPYTGQLRKLRRALSEQFEIFLSDRDKDTLAAEGVIDNDEHEGASDRDEVAKAAKKAPQADRNPRTLVKKKLDQTLRLATVDNFQGEEAKVIIVSLVRSNSMRKVGFLRSENRINVLLSRAQHGMYLIGNSATYQHVPMWESVHDQLVLAGAVGAALPLCCPRHPERSILCSQPEDFTRKSPEGGCELPCGRRLHECGHQCQARCHSDMMHKAVDCVQFCERIRATCNHICPKLCGQDCGPCQVNIESVVLPCGHVKRDIACYQLMALETVKCRKQVLRTVPGCQHIIEVECNKKIDSTAFRCPNPCGKLLQCGHSCPGACGSCRKQTDGGPVVFEHGKCAKICDRPYGICNHRCPKQCHDGQPCGSCSKPCEVRCPHSRCDLSCDKPCTPCIEPCAWACEHHGSCSMPCSAPCDRIPCNERCSKALSCGHQCPSYCGEECPVGYCQTCGDRGTQRVDMLEFKEYSEIDVNETPIVVLSCGHFFTGETLDGMVGFAEVYATSDSGDIVGVRDLSGLPASSSIPCCPDCKYPIRQYATRRYNRVINRAVMDETLKRFITKGSEDLAKLEYRLSDIEDRLFSSHADGSIQDEPERHTSDSEPRKTKQYLQIKRLESDASILQRNMDSQHQPSKKLLDAIVSRQQRRLITGSISSAATADSLDTEIKNLRLEPDLAPPDFDKRVTLGAALIGIKVREIALRDKLRTAKTRPSLARTIVVQDQVSHFLKDCEELIEQARQSFLVRIEVSSVLSLARISELGAWYNRTQLDAQSEKQKQRAYEPDEIRKLLESASTACNKLHDARAEELQNAIQATLRLYEGPRYEPITPEELMAIKTAMLSGRTGMATHSGHWYNCANGHPFAIGECGMPMEQASCPECGAPIGGQSHSFVDGVTRASEMEN